MFFEFFYKMHRQTHIRAVVQKKRRSFFSFLKSTNNRAYENGQSHKQLISIHETVPPLKTRLVATTKMKKNSHDMLSFRGIR